MRIPPPPRYGGDHPRWKGGRYVTLKGYVYIRLQDGRYRGEHRIKMEEALGRPLSTSEVVHHRNGHKQDNVPKNFRLMRMADHSKEHWRQRRQAQSQNQLKLFEVRQESLF